MRYEYRCNDCLKCLISEMNLPLGIKCNCTPPKVLKAVVYRIPLSEELVAVLDVAGAHKLRAELCNVWGIENKSHKHHGSNFSRSQPVVDIIHDIVAPIANARERGRVRMCVIEKYDYDIETRMMCQ